MLTDVFVVGRRLVETKTERDDRCDDQNDQRHVVSRFPDELQKYLRPLGGKRVGAELLPPPLQVVCTDLE